MIFGYVDNDLSGLWLVVVGPVIMDVCAVVVAIWLAMKLVQEPLVEGQINDNNDISDLQVSLLSL